MAQRAVHEAENVHPPQREEANIAARHGGREERDRMKRVILFVEDKQDSTQL